MFRQSNKTMSADASSIKSNSTFSSLKSLFHKKERADAEKAALKQQIRKERYQRNEAAFHYFTSK